jgi:hypothetical protein
MTQYEMFMIDGQQIDTKGHMPGKQKKTKKHLTNKA